MVRAASASVDHTKVGKWAALIMPVIKKDGIVWIYDGYRLAVNKAAKLKVYPLPRIKDLLASLGGGKTLTKLDLSHAYLQVQLDEVSEKYITVNTHRDLFQYQRLSLESHLPQQFSALD